MRWRRVDAPELLEEAGMIRSLRAALPFALLLLAWPHMLAADDGTGTRTQFIIVNRYVVLEGSGINTLPSSFNVPMTVDRLRTLIELKGMSIYAEIDHQLEAKRAGRTMPPMLLLVFGGPTVMTPLLPDAPTLGLDLPYTMLVYELPGTGTVIAYDDPAWLAQRHGLIAETDEIRRVGGVLEEIVRAAGS
jgi:uncharacterized protein (DUF302 family)